MNADQALDRLGEINVRLLQVEAEANLLREEHAKLSTKVFEAVLTPADAQGVKRFVNRGTVYVAERKVVRPVEDQLPQLSGEL